MYTFSQPAVVLAVVLVLAVACSIQPPLQTSSRPKAAHFAAAVERSLYFVFALAFDFAFALPLPLPLLLLLLLLLLCSCRFYIVILSAAKNPRISEGSVATRAPFSSIHLNTVISTGDTLLDPHPFPSPYCRFTFSLPPGFSCQAPKHPNSSAINNIRVAY